jgi:hypothetical protein
MAMTGLVTFEVAMSRMCCDWEAGDLSGVVVRPVRDCLAMSRETEALALMVVGR